jgi:nitrite reductase/ring-hydroxylating ferredoxin subunit
MKHPLCKVADVPDEGTIRVPFFGRELHVYRTGERIRAAANTCLHFGGPLDCRDGKFVCGWHGAEFDMGSGERLAGPAPAASRLMFVSTREEGDTLYYVWGE